MKQLKAALTCAATLYLVLFVMVVTGHGFEKMVFGFELKAHNPVKLFGVLVALLFLRFLLALSVKHAALVLGSLIFSLLTIEGALWVVDVPMSRTPELQRWRKPSPTLGWELIPNLKGVGSYGYDISINSQGIRDIERPLEKPAGTKRILGIGDSFTFGVGVELSQTFLKLLEKLLADSGETVDVINAGNIGYSMYQSTQYLKERGWMYSPNIVLYGFFLDDLGGATRAEDVASIANAEYAEPPKTRSRLLNLVKNGTAYVSSHFRYMQGADWLKDAEHRRAHFSPPDSAQVEVLRTLLTEMKAASAASGAELVVVLIPDAAQVNYPPLQKVNELLRTVCAEFGVRFIDPTPLFEKESDPTSLYLFPLDAHTSPKGNELIARAVFEELKGS